jgi:MtrB/PioB family decaheme-associated outer membrane protein
MKFRQHPLQPTALALAVAALIAAMPAWADDEELAALKLPTNTIELGGIGVKGASGTTDVSKFGEYNGLNKTGVSTFMNINARGGSAYDNNEGGGLRRWSIKATDIGLSTANITGNVSEQGEWSLGFEYDELHHYVGNGYQTPYNISGNNYTLPSGFGVVNTSTTIAGANGAGGTTNLNTAQRAAFQSLDIANIRRNSSVNGSLQIDARTSLSFDFKHLDQSGAKLQGFGMAGFGGATGEAVAILPMPTQSSTDNINLALNWNGDGAYLTAAYYGSFFRNGYDRVNFAPFMTANSITANQQWMTTPPDNNFNQLNLSGGYQLAPKTKLVSNLSYGLNTQNAAFIAPEAGTMVQPIPATSLNGKVVNTHADVKITDQTTAQLSLSGGLKYDERDNQTPSNLYNFNAISGGNTAYYPNTPLSTRKVQTELAGDYRIAAGHAVHVGYVHEDLNRWCNSYAASTGIAAGVQGYYPAGTNCVVAKESRDDRIDATYRMKATDDVDFRIGYGYSDRKTTSDPYAIAAFIGRNGTIPGPVPATGNTTNMGQNAGDYYGFYPYFDASRTQQAVKGTVNWQLTEELSLGLTGRYTDDKYASTYGVQNGNSTSFNLDATYALSETGSVYAWATQQDRKRDMTNVQRYSTTASAASATAVNIPATATWTNTLKDSDTTIGLGIKQGGLLSGKLELSGDWAYSKGKSVYATALNYSGTTTGSQTCSNAAILSCGTLPDITSTLNQFRLTGSYQIDKKAKLIVRATHQRLTSSDYYYNGLAYNFSTNQAYTPNSLLATNQTAPNYTVNAVMASLMFTY